MAYGLSIQSFIRIVDSKGEESTINFNHPTNVDIGALKSTLRSTAALVDAMIRGQVIGAGIELIVVLPSGLSLKVNAIPGSDIEEGVRFAWQAASGGQTTFRIPTVPEAWLTEAGTLDYVGGDAMDLFIARIISGKTVGLSNARPSDAYGSDITAFISGTESFLASRG